MFQAIPRSAEPLEVVTCVIRALCRCPDLPSDPRLRLDSIPRLDSICLVQAVTDIERLLGVEVDMDRMDRVTSLADLAACFPARVS